MKKLTATLSDYLVLCKPKVVLLMLITAAIGMLLANDRFLMSDIPRMLISLFGIALVASAGAVFNHLADRYIDSRMSRTHKRPVASGMILPRQATLFGILLTISGLALLGYWVNPLTTGLAFCSLIGYAAIYTLFLKHATPLNIVIGGLAGATPPLLGWTAMTGTLHPYGLLLALIIFAWTPPHFWALAIYRHEDYKKAQVPMLPVTHGLTFTRYYILLYTLLMIATTLLPFATQMSGMLYLLGSGVLNGLFLYKAIGLCQRNTSPSQALKLFHWSIHYLFLLFLLLLADHFLTR